jgi:hypothetical protein
MNYIKHLKGFYQRIEDDEKITPHHISLYMALFQFWNNARFRGQFDINRQELMAMSRIGSPHTYARCIKQLNDWGYIEYSASSNRYSVSKVSCVRFDITSGTTTDIANDTANNTATGTTNSTLFINNTNYTKAKQKTSNFFDNGRRKKVNGNNPYHVVNDKDYSEPL